MLVIVIIILLLLLFWKVRGSAEIKYIPRYSRILGTKGAKWRIRDKITKISLKLGQRKLFFSELEFYNIIYKKTKTATVVYAGAASGSHTYYLANMFPDFKFILYDMNEFNGKLYECPNVELINKFFTDEIAAEYGAEPVYFISDIRTGETEEAVERDMKMQMQWCKRMNIALALLKFRLKWSAGKLEYFTGDIYTQTRIGATSTEMRLLTDCKKTKIYDNDEYNERVSYFQIHERNAWYSYDRPNIAGFDHCYDCWSEAKIAREYTATNLNPLLVATEFSNVEIPPHGLMPDEKNIPKKMRELSAITLKFFEEEIGKNRYSEKDAEENIKILSWVKPRQETPNFGLLRANNLQFLYDKIVSRPFYTRDLMLVNRTKIMPAEPYDKFGRVFTRRGNFLMALEFLMEFSSKYVIIITGYISKQYERLAGLFPDRNFVFYFPFKHPNFKAPNIEVILEYPKGMQKWRGKDVVAILDIHRLLPLSLDESRLPAMEIEYRICEEMQPKMAMYNVYGGNKKFTAHAGQLRIFPFGLFFKDFAKLVTDCKKKQVYDGQEISERFFTFTYSWRPHAYDVLVPIKTEIVNGIVCSKTGIDYCYDCKMETDTWLKFHSGDTKKAENSIMEFIEEDEKDALKKPPHGMLINKDTSKRLHLLAAYTIYTAKQHKAVIQAINMKRAELAEFQLSGF